MAKATVFNPQTGQRKVVTVGDPRAFEGGFQLEKKSPLDKTLTGTRSLPDDDSQLTNMQSVMRMLKTESDKAQPSPLFKLQNFESITGIKPITTGAITGAIEMGEKERFADIAERSKTLVDRLTAQEAKREVYQAENRKWFKDTLDDMDAESVSKLTGEDFENGLMGILTPELSRKIAGARARTVELARAKAKTGVDVFDFDLPQGKPQKTFEQFLKEEENKAGMSFAPGKREALRKQYEAQNIDSLTRVNQIEASQDAARIIFAQLPRTRAANFQSSFQNVSKSGDIGKIKNFLQTQALSVIPAEQRNRVIGRSGALLAINKIERDLATFESLGGNTNIFTGTRENIMNRIGTLASQEQARIANEIVLSIIAYRQSMTGAQFSAQEAEQYNSVFPSVGNIPALNRAKMQSLRDSFEMNQRGSIGSVIGQDTYDTLFTKPQEQRIRVRVKRTGKTGTIFQNEFDPKIYDAI